MIDCSGSFLNSFVSYSFVRNDIFALFNDGNDLKAVITDALNILLGSATQPIRPLRDLCNSLNNFSYEW